VGGRAGVAVAPSGTSRRRQSGWQNLNLNERNHRFFFCLQIKFLYIIEANEEEIE